MRVLRFRKSHRCDHTIYIPLPVTGSNSFYSRFAELFSGNAMLLLQTVDSAIVRHAPAGSITDPQSCPPAFPQNSVRLRLRRQRTA